jgi:hypothetical protein
MIGCSAWSTSGCSEITSSHDISMLTKIIKDGSKIHIWGPVSHWGGHPKIHIIGNSAGLFDCKGACLPLHTLPQKSFPLLTRDEGPKILRFLRRPASILTSFFGQCPLSSILRDPLWNSEEEKKQSGPNETSRASKKVIWEEKKRMRATLGSKLSSVLGRNHDC